MSNVDISANAKPETKRDLTLDELETVSGGTPKAGGHSTGGAMFLVFTFKLVAVKT
jgi:hypothetical protein